MEIFYEKNTLRNKKSKKKFLYRNCIDKKNMIADARPLGRVSQTCLKTDQPGNLLYSYFRF